MLGRILQAYPYIYIWGLCSIPQEETVLEKLFLPFYLTSSSNKESETNSTGETVEPLEVSESQ